MATKYQKRHSEVRALFFTGSSFGVRDLFDFIGKEIYTIDRRPDETLFDVITEKGLILSPNAWLIMNDEGNLSVMSDDAFHLEYE